jgi:hypothetical protein
MKSIPDTSNNSNSSVVQSKYHFTVGGIKSKNYSVFHYGMEVGKINRYEGVSAADMRY